jgi:hypothetical protein
LKFSAYAQGGLSSARLEEIESFDKLNLFSVQTGMPLADKLNSVGYTDKVPFLAISKSDIYHQIKVIAIDIRLANLRHRTSLTLPIVGKSTVSIYPIYSRWICERLSY